MSESTANDAYIPTNAAVKAGQRVAILVDGEQPICIGAEGSGDDMAKDVSTASAAAAQAAQKAQAALDATDQHFFTDDHGAHVSTAEGTTEGARAVTVNSEGIVMQDADGSITASFTEDGVTFFDADGKATASFTENGAVIGKSAETHMTLNPNGISIDTLEIEGRAVIYTDPSLASMRYTYKDSLGLIDLTKWPAPVVTHEGDSSTYDARESHVWGNPKCIVGDFSIAANTAVTVSFDISNVRGYIIDNPEIAPPINPETAPPIKGLFVTLMADDETAASSPVMTSSNENGHVDIAMLATSHATRIHVGGNGEGFETHPMFTLANLTVSKMIGTTSRTLDINKPQSAIYTDKLTVSGDLVATGPASVFPNLAYAAKIPANYDLNDVKTVGTYTCTTSASTKTLLNCPAARAFRMTVFKPFSIDGDSVAQELTDYAGVTWRRCFMDWNDTWSEWALSTNEVITVALSANYSLTKAAATVPFSKMLSRTGLDLSLASNGVKCARSGKVLISANCYAADGMSAGDGIGFYAYVGSARQTYAYTIIGSRPYESMSITPILAEVNAGDVVTMMANNDKAARGVLRATNNSTYLTVQYV